MYKKHASFLIKTFVAALVALVVFPFAAIAAESPYVGGYKHIDKTLYEVPTTQNGPRALRAAPATLPSRYRSDEQPWAEGIVVKDQDLTGICWAESVTTAAEYSYAKELYETTGEVGVVDETSPAHLAQFLYNRVDDPLHNTADDQNYLVYDHWALAGGNQLYAMQHLATWSGLALESSAPIDETTAHIDWDTYEWVGDELVYDDSLAYDDSITMQESIVVFGADEDTVKSMVYEYGAVSTSIAWYDEFLACDGIDDEYGVPYEEDPETGEIYYYGLSFYDFMDEPYFNHAVTIVGWDDNYAKENFTHIIYDEYGDPYEDSFELTTPSRDGAWIVQNSWGDYVHDGGFVYVSYDCIEFDEYWSEFYAFDMQEPDTYDYDFQYDGTAFCYDSSDPMDDYGTHYDFYTKAGSRAANVYTNTTGETITLDAIGFTTYNDGTTHFNVYVYTNLSNPNDPTSGALAGTTRVTTETAGCKTAELDEPVIVTPGTTFAIVIYFPETNAFGVEMGYVDDDWDIEVGTEAGQSFFSASAYGAWKDMDNYEACFRIKGFASVTEAVPYEPNSVENIDGVLTKTDAAGNPDYSYTGFAHNKDGWWWVDNGIVTYKKTGFEETEYGWYYVENSFLSLKKTGFVEAEGYWFYIENSYLSLKKTGFIEAGGYWWYVKNSYLSLTRTGLYQGGSNWWYVQNGRINLNKNDVVQNSNGWWVVRNGRVDFSYNGTIVAGGVRWKVSGGKLVGRA